MRARRKKEPNKEKWLYCIYPQGFPGKILIFTVVWKTRLAQQNINFYGYTFFLNHWMNIAGSSLY